MYLPFQKGFAVIPLVILTLFGIAAGTLLVQNGVNFLPKAQEALSPGEVVDPIDWGPCLNYSYYKVGGNYGPPIIKNRCTVFRRITAMTNNSENKCVISFQEEYDDDPNCPFANPDPELQRQSTDEERCKAKGTNYVFIYGRCLKPCKLADGSEVSSGITQPLSCSADPEQKGKRFYQTCTDGVTENRYKNDPTCETQSAPKTTDYCTLLGIKEPGLDSDVVLKKNEVWKGCDTEHNKVIYLCKGNNQLSVSIEERSSPECGATRAAPAVPAAAAPRAVGQPITAGAPDAATAPKPAPESPQKAGSFDNKVAAVDCPEQKHREYCAANASSHGVSTGKCYLINGKARCQYGKDHGACNSSDSSACTNRGGCVLEKITVGSEQIQFSRCADDQSSSGSSAQSGTTGCETLKDADGLTIPCYKIGVFTPEELKATEAQAKVALQRYDQYKKILSEVSGEIDSAIKAKAEEKIREAERLANACLARS